ARTEVAPLQQAGDGALVTLSGDHRSADGGERAARVCRQDKARHQRPKRLQHARWHAGRSGGDVLLKEVDERARSLENHDDGASCVGLGRSRRLTWGAVFLSRTRAATRWNRDQIILSGSFGGLDAQHHWFVRTMA